MSLQFMLFYDYLFQLGLKDVLLSIDELENRIVFSSQV